MSSATEHDPYEPYLHRKLLAEGQELAARPNARSRQGEVIARRVFDLLLDTHVLALRKNAGEVVTGLISAGYGEVIAEWAVHAAEARSGMWGLRELTVDATVSEALLPLLSHPSKWVRRDVVRILEPVAGEQAVQEALLALTNDPSWYVRLGALTALEPFAMTPRIRQGLASLLSDPDCNVLAAVVRLLGPESLATVRDAMRLRLYDPDSGVREYAAQLLANSHSELIEWESFQPLVNHPDAHVRRIAISVMERHKNDSLARNSLINLLHDEDSYTRTLAIEALKPFVANSEAQDALLALVRGEDTQLRGRAVKSLEAAAQEPKVRKTFLEILNGTSQAWPDASLRIDIAKIVATARVNSEPVDWAILQSLLTHSDFQVRERAVVALTPLTAYMKVKEALLAALSDDVWYVQISAANALLPVRKEIDVQRAVRATVLSLLSHPNEDVRRIIGYSLERELVAWIDDPDILIAVTKALQDSNERVRQNMATAIRSVISEQFKINPILRRVLLHALTDPDHFVRAHIASGLQCVNSEQDVRDALTQLVHNDESMSVRQAAAWALWPDTSDAQVQYVLITTITRWAYEVMPSSIVQALASLTASDEGCERMRDLLRSSPGPMRRALLRALAHIPSRPSLIDTLGAMLREWPSANEAYSTLSRWTTPTIGQE